MVPAAKQAWIMVVGTNWPVWSGESFGTATALPSTLTVRVSTGGGAGLVSDVGAAAMSQSLVAPSFARFTSSAFPFATNSSLNLVTKLCTGQEQASPKAQMVRPPGMLLAILSR